MKQPKIKIFGKTHNVMVIGFDKNGAIEKIVYQVTEHHNRTVFKRNEIIDKSLTSKREIHEPTLHPYHNYAYAPDLESLLVV